MKGTIHNDGQSITVEVPIIQYKRGDMYVAYCPHLDLMTYSQDQNKLEGYFENSMNIFMEHEMEQGTLRNTLEKLGWTLKEKEVKKPSRVSLPDYMLSNMPIHTTSNVPVAVPVV